MDNATFWDERYRLLPQLGSGQGSRGYAAWYKNRLIKQTIAAYGITSLVDIGCGDLCWLDPEILQQCDYTGFDISAVAVERAKTAYPTLRFAVHDVTLAPVDVAADLVVSFDVLIHQVALPVFRAALGNIVAAIGRIGLVSYMTPPLPDGSFPAAADAGAAGADMAVLQREAEFRQMMEEGLPRDFPKPETVFHEPLSNAVSALRPDMAVIATGRYRYQTVYAISPGQQTARESSE